VLPLQFLNSSEFCGMAKKMRKQEQAFALELIEALKM
jgi:hypothetical protein